MGRRAGGSFKSRKPAPSARPTQQSRPASTSAPRQAPASSVPAKPAAAPAPAPAAAPAAAPQGPGFLAGMAQIAGGVAMGHAITAGVSSLMSSGSDDGASQEHYESDTYVADDEPCAEFRFNLNQCLDRYGSDISACQFAMDALTECRSSRLQ